MYNMLQIPGAEDVTH